ncbi:hypothetical protein CC78DRAFT_582653 [Lojkania enalia]|uniref:Uncharacterized protein n=1 Tax=Lojkania enalia TaxID=147567 RepID=A0A9P4K7D6_9PLEO|nr:hypothetical protein CC78DRAFT_582653 [Didymosphaeria enalia]
MPVDHASIKSFSATTLIRRCYLGALMLSFAFTKSSGCATIGQFDKAGAVIGQGGVSAPHLQRTNSNYLPRVDLKNSPNVLHTEAGSLGFLTRPIDDCRVIVQPERQG